MINKKFLITCTIITSIFLFAILQTNQNIFYVKAINITFGSIFVLFLPWYFLTANFFKNKKLDTIEKFALSFLLSISIIPLLMIHINSLNISINQISLYLVALSIILANIIYYYILPQKRK